MEAGSRQGHPRGGGTARIIGTEEKTAFSLSTDTESDLSPIWRIKISCISEVPCRDLCRAEITEV